MKKVLLAVAILGLTLNAYAWDSDSGWQPSLSTELTNLQTDINSSAGANFTTDVSVGGDVSVTGNVSTARLDLVGAGGNITGNEYGQYIDFGKVPNAVLVGGTSLTQGLTVLNTGYVGIGKTNPSQELQILDIGNDGVSMQWGATTTPNRAYLGALGTYPQRAFLGGMSGYNVSLRAGGVDVFFANIVGNVGIGSTAPTARLEIKGSSTAISESLYINGGTQFERITGNTCAQHILTVGAGGTITSSYLYVTCPN